MNLPTLSHTSCSWPVLTVLLLLQPVAVWTGWHLLRLCAHPLQISAASPHRRSFIKMDMRKYYGWTQDTRNASPSSLTLVGSRRRHCVTRFWSQTATPLPLTVRQPPLNIHKVAFQCDYLTAVHQTGSAGARAPSPPCFLVAAASPLGTCPAWEVCQVVVPRRATARATTSCWVSLRPRRPRS